MVESKEAWVRRLKERGFRREKEFDRVESSRVEGGKDEEDEERDVKEIHKINKSIGKGKDNDKDRCKDSDKDYNYLLSLPIWSFCR